MPATETVVAETDHPIPQAGPTLLLGVGGAGERIATRVKEWLQEDPLARAGGIVLVPFGKDGSPVRTVVREAAIRLTRQRAVGVLEAGHAIRQPRFQYLRLHAVCIAALAESGLEPLRESMRALFDIKHPPHGMEMLFLLDVTSPEDPNETAPSARETLEGLEAEWRSLCDRARAQWGVAPRLRFLLAHPHRSDGSRLDHENLNGRAGDGGVASRKSQVASEDTQNSILSHDSRLNTHDSTLTSPDSLPACDEFEATLAAAVAGHITPGVLHGCLLPEEGGESGRPVFALFGWAVYLFPRERILRRAARLLAADVLECTAYLPKTDEPPPTEPGDYRPRAARLLTRDAKQWQDWLKVRERLLLQRREVLRRVLLDRAVAGRIRVQPGEEETPRRSLFRRLRERFFGATAPDESSRGPGLAVALALKAGDWRHGDPRRWPEEIKKLDDWAKGQFKEIVTALNASEVAQQAAEEIVVALVQCSDECVRRFRGGTEAARELIDEAIHSAERSVRNIAEAPFSPPLAPKGLGLRPSADLREAWSVFQDRCERMPGWPATTARGLGFAALLTTGFLAAGLPISLLWWAGPLVCVGAASALYGARLAKLRLLGLYVEQCIAAKFGRRLHEYAQRAAGTPDHAGVYQSVVRLLREVEIPTLERFDAERVATVAQAREKEPFPDPEGTADYLADAEDAARLHQIVCEDEKTRLDEDADELLQQGLLRSWRHPAFDRILDAVSAHERAKRLKEQWQTLPVGDFRRKMIELATEPQNVPAALQAWTRQRLDLLAMRSMLLALRPPVHPERSNPEEERRAPQDGGVSPYEPGELEADLLMIVPPSLPWYAAHGEPPPDEKEKQAETALLPPANSAASALARWLVETANAERVLLREGDVAVCRVRIGGLTAAQALRACSGESDAASVPDAAPASVPAPAGAEEIGLTDSLPEGSDNGTILTAQPVPANGKSPAGAGRGALSKLPVPTEDRP